MSKSLHSECCCSLSWWRLLRPSSKLLTTLLIFFPQHRMLHFLLYPLGCVLEPGNPHIRSGKLQASLPMVQHCLHAGTHQGKPNHSLRAFQGNRGSSGCVCHKGKNACFQPCGALGEATAVHGLCARASQTLHCFFLWLRGGAEPQQGWGPHHLNNPLFHIPKGHPNTPLLPHHTPSRAAAGRSQQPRAGTTAPVMMNMVPNALP